jgi:hypothetical protein
MVQEVHKNHSCGGVRGIEPFALFFEEFARRLIAPAKISFRFADKIEHEKEGHPDEAQRRKDPEPSKRTVLSGSFFLGIALPPIRDRHFLVVRWCTKFDL